MSVIDDNLLIIGRISSVFGIKGWVKCVSHSRPRENIFSYSDWYVKQKKSQWQKLQLEDGKPQGKTLVAKLAGIDSREQAEDWIGATIAVTRDMLPANEKDDFYWVDLIGLEVETTSGERIGKVDRLMETGSNDVLVVIDDQSGDEHLIPWVMEQVIVKVNLTQGQILVDWDTDF